jgi:hypothetical protein
MKDVRPKLCQAGSYVLAAIVIWRDPYGLESSEFSGGRVTGPLLDLHNAGWLLFAASAWLVFLSRKAAAAVALCSAVLAIPLCLYFLAPGPFRWIVKGQYSVTSHSLFVADKWVIESVLAISLAAVASIYTLRSRGKS